MTKEKSRRGRLSNREREWKRATENALTSLNEIKGKYNEAVQDRYHMEQRIEVLEKALADAHLDMAKYQNVAANAERQRNTLIETIDRILHKK